MAGELIEAGLYPEPEPLLDREAVRDALLGNPGWLKDDPQLLAALDLRLDAANVVDFGPVALSRVAAAHEREFSERRRLEAMAQANFTAQAQTHAAVLDVLASSDPGDLADRIDRMARLRFGLVVGSLALEGAGVPEGWLPLVGGQSDLLLGPSRATRLGRAPTAAGLLGAHAPVIESVALARLTIGASARQGILTFGAFDSEAFTEDMGDELVLFLARVVERVAERWLPD